MPDTLVATLQDPSGPVEPLYRLTGVERHFRMGSSVVRAVDHVDLALYPGELVAIEGPSGSGKSTMLQLLGGLDRPTEGSVVLTGRNLASLGDPELTGIRASEIGFVFQSFNLIPTLTASENVEVAMVPVLRSRSERQARATKLLEQVGLAERARHLPSLLSGGEQQRVAIARAMANRPRVILADEPTGNLDTRSTAEIGTILRSLAADQGVTVIIVTHSEAVSSWASRRLRMRDGKLFEMTAEEIAASAAAAMGEAPEVAVGSPEVAVGSPEVAVGSPEVAVGSPEVAVGSPEVAVGSPEVAVGSPEVAVGSPEVAVGSPEVAVGSPEVVVGSPEVVVGSPEVVVGSPEVVVGSPEVVVGSPEVVVGPVGSPAAPVGSPEAVVRAGEAAAEAVRAGEAVGASPRAGISGIHVLLFSPEAEALRGQIREVFGWSNVDLGDGWLLFAAPPAELAVHPGVAHHELSLMCQDLDATLAELRAKGVEVVGEPVDRAFGRAVTLRLAGGVEVLLYQPAYRPAS